MRKLILISVLLNLGLVGAIAVFATKQSKTPVEKVETKANEKTSRKGKARSAQAKAGTTEIVVNVDEEKFSWRNVESADYKEFIANLRAIQCPEETVRDIIIADVNKFYASRLKPLRKPVEEFKFWENDNNWGGRRESEEYYKTQRETMKEKAALLRELLGGDYEKEMAAQYGMWGRGTDPFAERLPQETKDKLSEISWKFEDERNEIYRKAKGYHDEETQTDLRKVERKLHEEMAKVLSPEDLFEWELRNSHIAQNMKWNELQGFDATEEEFRAVFKAKQAAEFAKAESDPENHEKAAHEMERQVQKEAEETLKRTLGEDRYKEYQMAQNWEYKELSRIAERQGISKESTKKAYEMKAEVEKAARQINSDKNLTSEQRRGKLLEIQNATKAEVTTLLGERGYKSWNRNAWWVRNLVPSEPTKSTIKFE